MALTLEQVLGAPVLTAAIRTGAAIPPTVVPAPFQTVTDRVVGDRFAYRQRSIRSATAKRVNYGNPSVRRGLVDVGSASVVMVHTNENIMHNFLTFQNLCQSDNLVLQNIARDEVQAQNDEFAGEIGNLRAGVFNSIFANGSVSFDSNDELLPNATGAANTISYNIPSGNQSQLNVFGDGNLLGTGWQNPTADIDGDIRRIDQALIRLVGAPGKYIFYGMNIPKYIQTNNVLKEYFVRNQTMNAAILGGAGIPDPLYGKIWIPAYQAYFKDQSGAYKTFFGADSLTICPEPTKNWWKFAVGTFPVPTTLGNIFTTTAEAVTAAVELVYGQFGYARLVQEETPGLKQIAGDTFMPVITNPNAMMMPSVNF